jgi:hypothetical protein
MRRAACLAGWARAARLAGWARAARLASWARAAALGVALAIAVTGSAMAAPRLELAARAGRVTVLAEPGLDRMAEQLAARAEATLTRIAGDLLDLPRPGPIEVRLVAQAADLAAVAPAGRGAPPWTAGVAYPDLGIIAVAVRRGPTLLDAGATLRHELAHVALGAALGPRVPRWLHEGFAYQHSAEWSWARAETLAGMSWLGSIIPLAELERAFPAEELPAHRAYAQSYDFVGFLTRRGRWDDAADDGDRWPFRRFLAAIARTGDVDAAARAAYGQPLAALFDEWRADLGRRYLMMPIGLLGLAAWMAIGVLVVLAWRRRRRQNGQRVARWEAEEQARAVVAPPYVAWPGEDPFADIPEPREAAEAGDGGDGGEGSDDDRDRREPPLLN